MKKKKFNKIARKKLFTILFFLIKFNLLAIPLYLIIRFDISFPSLQIFLAKVLHSMFKISGYHAIRDGYYIALLSDNTIRTIAIDMDCTGWKSLYALFALVLATPLKKNKSKLNFLAFALPTLFFINIFRIYLTVTFCHIIGFQYLDIIHNLFWREGLILVIIILWYWWLRKEKYNISYI